MKKNYLFYLALAATPLFTACSNEELANSEEPAEGTPVTFTIGEGGAVTRTVTTEETAGYKTVFTADEAVGIYATGAASATNAQFTVNAEGNKLESNTPITIANTGTADFVAYSPYQSAVTNTYQFTVKSDQTTAANFNASNLLTATCAGVTASSPTVSFTFQPRLAIVRVEMAGAEGVNTSAVTLNAKPQVTWTAATDALSEAEGTATDIKMWHQNATAAASVDAATNQLFAAFVPAQQIEAGTSFLTMAVGQKQYRFKPKSAFTLSAGKINKFKVTIGKNGEITIESITIDVQDWEVNDLTNIEGDLEEILPEPEPAIVLIDKKEHAPSASALQATTGLQGTKEGWNALIDANKTNSTIAFDEDEAAYKIADDGTGEWYRKMLVFRTPNNAGSLGKYTLTFNVKTTNGKEICVRAMKGQVKDVFTSNAYFNTNDAEKSSGQALTTVAGEWAAKSMTIDLSVLSNQAATTDDLAYGVMICFAIKTVSESDEIYIKDVQCEEIKETAAQ